MGKEEEAIYLIRMAADMSKRYYGKPFVCTYSGGKDSDVVLELCKRAGVPFVVQHSITTVDAPQTMQHIRKVFDQCKKEGIRCEYTQPTYKGKRVNMWSLIPIKGMPPTRMMRYCCEVLKEQNAENRVIKTGVRWAESRKRATRSEVETITKKASDSIKADRVMLANDNDASRDIIDHCRQKGKVAVNPIISWSDADVWDFIRGNEIEYNPLYDCGYHRVRCVGCPMAGKGRWKEFADFPGFKKKYIKAFSEMLDKMRASGKNPRWKTGEEVFLWWMEDDNVSGQMSFDDFPEMLP